MRPISYKEWHGDEWKSRLSCNRTQISTFCWSLSKLYWRAHPSMKDSVRLQNEKRSPTCNYHRCSTNDHTRRHLNQYLCGRDRESQSLYTSDMWQQNNLPTGDVIQYWKNCRQMHQQIKMNMTYRYCTPLKTGESHPHPTPKSPPPIDVKTSRLQNRAKANFGVCSTTMSAESQTYLQLPAKTAPVGPTQGTATSDRSIGSIADRRVDYLMECITLEEPQIYRDGLNWLEEELKKEGKGKTTQTYTRILDFENLLLKRWYTSRPYLLYYNCYSLVAGCIKSLGKYNIL